MAPLVFHVLEIVILLLVMRWVVFLVTQEIAHVVQMEDFSAVQDLPVRIVTLLVRLVVDQEKQTA